MPTTTANLARQTEAMKQTVYHVYECVAGELRCEVFIDADAEPTAIERKEKAQRIAAGKLGVGIDEVRTRYDRTVHDRD